MNVLYLHADLDYEWNCSEWRCIIPARAISSIDGHDARALSLSEFCEMTNRARAYGEWSDVIVFQRNMMGMSLVAMTFWKSQGKICIIDVDDDYFHMPPDIQSYDFWFNGVVTNNGVKQKVRMKYKPIEQLIWGAKLADGITTPSESIASDWKKINDNVHIVPNYLDWSRYDDLYRDTKEPLTIGWGGSLSHYTSFRDSGVMAALKRVLETYPNLNLVVIGDRAVWDAIKIFPDRKKFIKWMKIGLWPKVMAKEIDIAIVPLSGTYDKSRSWIKPLEFMAAGIPTVASNYPMYQQFSDFITLVDNKPKYWEKALIDIIENWNKRKERAMRSRLYAKTLDAKKNAHKIIETYQAIIDQQ